MSARAKALELGRMSAGPATGRVIAFIGGMILTMDRPGEDAEVLIVRNERIADIGGRELLDHYPDADVVNLRGRTLLPAFIDSHNHLSFACFEPRWFDLLGMTDKQEMLASIRKFGQSHDGSDWIVGFPLAGPEDGGPELTRHDLDEACRDRPVLLIHGTIHKLILNSKGLELAGIGDSAPEPTFGRIVRDAEGDLTGEIWGTAEVDVLKLVLKFDTPEYAELIEARAKELLAYGITAVHDPGVTPGAAKAYELLHSQGRLPVSVLMMPHGEALFDNRVERCLNGPKAGWGDELLRVGPIKLFGDGGAPGQMAMAGKIGGREFTSGSFRTDFYDNIIEATRRGYRVCVHSIGNVTTDAALDAFEKAAEVSPSGFEMRPRIEHMFLLSDAQIERLARLGGCASIQPFFFARMHCRKPVPLEGYKWFPFGDLVRSGARVCANSDDPGFGSMSSIDPIKGSLIGAGMGDEGSAYYRPEQAMPLEQWLWMYTAGAAYAGGLENERGSLRKGLMADLVVLSGMNRGEPVVEETWKAGQKVFSRSGRGS